MLKMPERPVVETGEWAEMTVEEALVVVRDLGSRATFERERVALRRVCQALEVREARDAGTQAVAFAAYSYAVPVTVR